MANKSENKFSVGDKVVCIDADKYTAAYGLHLGEQHTISHIVNGADGLQYVGLVELGHERPEWAAFRFNLVKRAESTQQKEKEMTFKNMKFDVAAIAKQLNVEHEEASRVIQEALFEQGYSWYSSGVHHLNALIIFSDQHGQLTCTRGSNNTHVWCLIKPTYTIVEAEEQQEVVGLNGKKYNKQELEKALSLLNPID